MTDWTSDGGFGFFGCSMHLRFNFTQLPLPLLVSEIELLSLQLFCESSSIFRCSCLLGSLLKILELRLVSQAVETYFESGYPIIYCLRSSLNSFCFPYMEELFDTLSKVLDEQTKFKLALSIYQNVDYLRGDYFQFEALFAQKLNLRICALLFFILPGECSNFRLRALQIRGEIRLLLYLEFKI